MTPVEIEFVLKSLLEAYGKTVMGGKDTERKMENLKKARKMLGLDSELSAEDK